MDAHFITSRIHFTPFMTCTLHQNIRVIKSRRTRLAQHVARMGTGEVHVCFWWGDLKERDHLEDLRVDVRIIFKWMFNKWDGSMDQIELPQRWRALLRVTLNLSIP